MLPVEAQDPEQRIADLQRQLAETQRIAELERQLAEAKSAEQQSRGASGYVAQSYRRPAPTGREPAAAPRDDRLAAAPRKVPIRFLLAEVLPFRWWYVWTLFMVAVAPIAVWINMPTVFAAVAVVTLVVIYGFQLRGTWTRMALLNWGQVATVNGTDVEFRGTYYSGTTWYNAPLPVAHGWQVARPLYSGPSTKTRIRYALAGYQGELVVRGREYIDGVILADQRNPARARCVTSFAYDLDRDESGNWVGTLRPRLQIGMAVWALIVIVWLVVAAAIATGVAGHLVTTIGTVDISAGGTAGVSGNSTTKTVNCNDGHLNVSGNANTVTVNGHCASLVVSGNNNIVTVDAADTISVSGIGARVTYHSGSPQIDNEGISNVVTQG
jgi:Protein of unknown function (DUF3060)